MISPQNFSRSYLSENSITRIEYKVENISSLTRSQTKSQSAPQLEK